MLESTVSPQMLYLELLKKTLLDLIYSPLTDPAHITGGPKPAATILD